MPMPPYASEPGFGEGPGQFRSTHWSVVLAAADSQCPQTAQALEKLCRTYWYPLYAHVRRQGIDGYEAQDLTQAFFAYLLEKKGLGRVNPMRGKFRSFLLASLNNFLNNERDKAQRIKRGGGIQFIYLDAVPAEDRYLAEPAHDENPEKIFERRWANAVVEQAVRNLTAEFVAAGLAQRLEVLKVFLMGEPSDASYEEAARRLSLSVSAVTSAIHRARQRFRELFREEISNTVSAPDEVDDEIRHLLNALDG
ncbi:MAG TPA: sigma-70 family RNA polymerase sigma factor [Verrucomicrobiae bacterium]|nr:sigma-70 family RNA polymerase sigma factor [Verrucomicrobiae bacterium]